MRSDNALIDASVTKNIMYFLYVIEASYQTFALSHDCRIDTDGRIMVSK